MLVASAAPRTHRNTFVTIGTDATASAGIAFINGAVLLIAAKFVIAPAIDGQMRFRPRDVATIAKFGGIRLPLRAAAVIAAQQFEIRDQTRTHPGSITPGRFAFTHTAIAGGFVRSALGTFMVGTTTHTLAAIMMSAALVTVDVTMLHVLVEMMLRMVRMLMRRPTTRFLVTRFFPTRFLMTFMRRPTTRFLVTRFFPTRFLTTFMLCHNSAPFLGDARTGQKPFRASVAVAKFPIVRHRFDITRGNVTLARLA